MDISNIGGVRGDISEMLSKIREVSNKSKVFAEGNVISPTESTHSFEGVFSAAKMHLLAVIVMSQCLK
jgi:hypothetical protein